MNSIKTLINKIAPSLFAAPKPPVVRYESANAVSSTKICKDGNPIFLRDWPLAPDITPRGLILIVHGLGEHIGRFDHVADHFNQWGFAVRGYDQYGHGRTGGPRGGLPSNFRLLDDLAEIIDDTRKNMDPNTPLILLGHSMGGLVVGRFVALTIRPVDGLIMSSPALDPGISLVQRILLAVVPVIAPDLRVGNGVDAQYLSHDKKVVSDYLADPLGHDRISGRLARFIAKTGSQTVDMAPHWKVPTLLIYSGDERVLEPLGSTRFGELAPKEVVTTQRFDHLYHEIFNESDAAPVFDAVKNWLDLRFPLHT
jgi:alpha-beta hydrolase superfamily lysophospholipase